MVDVVQSRATRLAKLAGLLGFVALVSTGCSAVEVLAFGWPEGVTPQAQRMRELWIGSVIASLVVGAIVWGLILWSIAFHRKRPGGMPRQTQYNLPLEIVYTVIPFIIISVLFYFTVITQNFVDEQRENPDVAIGVTAFQWNWEFVYLQPGGQRPMTTSHGEPINTVGTAETVPILVVPTRRVVEYHIASVDVIHSFFVPDFLFKRDVFPNPEKNFTDNVFQTTVDTAGAFVGRCAEFCGTYHQSMNFEIRALPPDLFDRYLRLRGRVNPNTLEPYTAGQALQQLGCGELCAPEAITTSPLDPTREQVPVAVGNP